jgi:tetratricopeptide (TPR) repeat protein
MAGNNGRTGSTSDDGRRPFGGRSISALLRDIARSPEVDIGRVPARLRPGVIVDGRFEIVREVGSGGFGVVYEARDLSLGRTVAFKAVAGIHKRALQEDRLLREAVAAARLSHPNIVQLHDMGHSEFGPYLVLELLRGETLEARLASGALPPRQAMHTARDVASALAHAHAAGVVHRDLKPSNVFIGEGGHSKVLDFGLARAFGQRGVEGGTPAYMAPEQWRGAPEDERTDVFALGVLLFQMLTADLPFPDEKGARNARGPPILEVPEIPELGLLVQRMLARDPVDRPRDAAAVGRELEEMDGSGHETPPRPERDRPRARRRIPFLLTVAGMGVALLAGTALGAFLHQRTVAAGVAARTGRTTIVVADPVNQTGDPSLDALSPLLATALEQSRALDVPGRVRLLDLASRDALGSPGRLEPAVAREVARRMGAQVLIVPEIRRRGPDLVIQVRALEPERQQLLFEAEERGPSSDRMEAIPEMVERLAASVRQELRGSSDAADRAPGSGTAVTRSLEAYRHYLLGQQFANETFDIPAAIAEYKRALAVDPDFAMPHLEMAILAGWHDAPDEDPLTHMQSAARQAGRLPDKERRLVLGYQAFVENRHRESARILDALVLDYPLDKQVLYVTGEAFWHSDTPAGFARGASHFRAALDLDPAYLVAYIHLFAWIDRFGPREEALARADRAAKFRPSPQAQAMVSRALGAAGRWTEALASARNAASVSGGHHHFESSYAYAEALFGAGYRAEAEEELRQWLQPGADHGQRREAAEILSTLLAAQGRGREALDVFAAVAGDGAGHQYATWDTIQMAHLALAGGNMEGARRVLRAQRLPPPGEDHDADSKAWFVTWLGDVEEGKARAKVLSPGSLSERQYAGTKALQEGRHAEAAEILADVARRSPAVEPEFLRGLALFGAGRNDEALQAFEAVRSLHLIYAPPALASFQPWAEVLAAESLARLGRRDDALARVRAWLATWKRADPGLPLVAQARNLERRLHQP